MSRLEQVLISIDALNADDPSIERVEGKDVPREQLY